MPDKNLGQLEDSDFINTFFWKVLPNNSWRGKPCYIVAGGPSLEEHWSWLVPRLKGQLTIGINRTYEMFDPTIIFGMDSKFVNWVLAGKYGESALKKWRESKAYKVWLCSRILTMPKDVYILKCFKGYNHALRSFPPEMEEGIGHGNNSGYAALNLAACLSASPIYLLGFDMKRDRGKTHWHNGHPEKMRANIPNIFKKHFTIAKKALAQRNIDVINLNPRSALECFPRIEMWKGFESYNSQSHETPRIVESVPSVVPREDVGRKTITVITPTGDRPLAFALCQNWIRKQTLQPDQWIVVDDGKTPMKPLMPMQYVRREPQPDDPKYTLILNLKTALPLIKGNKILVIEDDEYYAPKYIETMVDKLNEQEIVGIGKSKYYHLPTGGNYIIPNRWHASLAQTAFRKSFLQEFGDLLNSPTNYLDMKIWEKIRGSKRELIFFDNNPLYVGIKGLPGRHGIGVGHRPNFRFYQRFPRDTSRRVLMQWIPDNDDYNIYMNIINGKLTEDNYKL